MKITNGKEYLEIKPISYEFPYCSPYYPDVFQTDSNWIMMEFKYLHDGKEVIKYNPCVLAGEVESFVRYMRHLLKQEEDDINCIFLEDYLDFDVVKSGDKITINVLYPKVDFFVTYTVEECRNFIDELELEFSKFPVRAKI